ncbi:endoglucanase F-like isoform X2 [Mercenaria mercenaria]|uniref:endoglucanase F-like isoform X2 n=1 Tax=Mercenaria mercenaria TaxID=6596 RepID=UPI00234E8D48|nr:endoglucanase F-like isoform X2 [Mercenaria mercenaria]
MTDPCGIPERTGSSSEVMSTVILLICLFGFTSGSSVQMDVLDNWDGRIHAKFSVPITEETNGWELIVNFSVPVGKIDEWMGDFVAHSADNQMFTLVNKPHNGILHPGDTLKVEMFINYPGSTPPTATAEFINLGHDNFIPPTAKPDLNDTKYDLNEVLEKSILFYEAQRSGKLPADNRIPWRGDSALQDRGDNGEDLTGGWYDAGDHIKFNFPMAFSVTSLAWGLLEFKDAYYDAGELDHMYDSIKWPLDYLMKCHVSPNVYYVQVGEAGKDHSFWGRPEDMTMDRPAYKIDESHPGSDIAAETAAAFAASYMVFKSKNATYAAELLRHAKELYAFAEAHPGKYSDSVNAAAGFYRSFDETDEMCWGGAWMYLATKDPHYLQVAESFYTPGAAWGQSWDEKNSGCMVLLYKVTHKDIYLQDIEATFTDWMPGGSIPYTPKGLAFRSQWGSNRYAANMALIAIMASMQGVHPEVYRKWAESQIDYILGDTGRSFVVGFGTNPPEQPHHRGSSCPMKPAPCASFQMNLDAPNPHVLYGAVVGGPGKNDDYTDKRTDYVTNEVACDYNAGFQSAVAGLKALHMRGEMK